MAATQRVCYNPGRRARHYVNNGATPAGVSTLRVSGLKLEVIAAAFVVVAGMVFGGQWLVDRYEVQRPLLASARGVDGVRQASVVEENGRTNLVVTMGMTRDFRRSYAELAGLLSATYGAHAGRVVVEDSRTERLERALYEVHFALQEGLSTGRFTSMRREVEAAVRRFQLPTPYLWVEDGRVYLGLHERGRVLYEVIERPAGVPDGGTERGSLIG